MNIELHKGLTLQRKDDGVWLSFAAFGTHAILNVDSLLGGLTDITRSTINAWVRDTINESVNAPVKPLVHVGAELAVDGKDVTVVGVGCGFACVQYDSIGELVIIDVQSTSLGPRKTAQQVEFDEAVDEMMSMLTNPDADDKKVCENLIKAGYRLPGDES